MANIWVLEEESLLLRATARWLEGSGHTIIPCWSLKLMRERASGVRQTLGDLFLMDQSSRDTSCAGLMIKCYIPRMKFLFIADEPVHNWSINCGVLFHALRPDEARILKKPFTGLELLTTVDDLIGIEPEMVMAKAAGCPA